MERLYDDHRNDSSPTQTAQVTTMTTGEGQQMQATGNDQQSANQPGGLDASSSTSGQNPVAAAVDASSWTHDDLLVVLSAVSIVAWVATTYYVTKEIQ